MHLCQKNYFIELEARNNSNYKLQYTIVTNKITNELILIYNPSRKNVEPDIDNLVSSFELMRFVTRNGKHKLRHHCTLFRIMI